MKKISPRFGHDQKLFIACLVNLQSNQLLLDIDNKKLFGNVEEIYGCNDLFWKKHLMPVVEVARKTGEPLNPELLREGFMDFPNIFKCYETYCTQQARCQVYCREKLQQDQDNELFTAYLAWCETQKECNRLKLLDILVKPMQRLTKYSLLLKAILKHTINPSHKESLTSMIKSVDFFVNNVNSTLKQNQDLETMKQLMSKIESYDVIESKDDDLSNLIQKYSVLNLTYDIPGTCHKRSLLFESDVKYKDAMTSSKIEVHAFLFTDFLLITKPVKRLGESKVKFKIIRQPFVIDHLVTQEIARDPPSLACVYLSIYRTACTAFMLSCSEAELVKSWSEAIRKAKSLFASLKSLQGVGGHLAHTPTAPPISRQPSGFANEDISVGDNMEESKTMTYNLGLWAGRSPRGSSYGSRISSLVHSHSGSMEMTENLSSISSVSASRGVSVENNSELRGSSLSSDDGNTNLPPTSRVELTTSPRIERRETPPGTENRESPVLHRPESKSFYRKSVTKTKNTLTIQVPHLGQSLPNLNIASSTGGASGQNPCPPNSLLLAPPKSHGGLLSPSSRGVSYPPPSPPRGSLKRGFAISPKNPLVKTGNVTMDLSRSVSVTQAPVDSDKPFEEKRNKTIGLQTNLDENQSRASSDTKCNQCSCNNRGNLAKSNGKKLVRSDKRYYTAGTIDDLKVKKDSSVHKRLSFNSGSGRTTGSDSTDSAPFNKHLSIASVQSSSGFSSAGSSVEGLFTKEDGSNGSRPFKFEEILHIINLEDDDDDELEKSQGQTDVERFDSKVSKWQKYGFDETKLDCFKENDLSSVNLGPRRANSPFGSAPTDPNCLQPEGKGGKSTSGSSASRVLSNTLGYIHSLTASIIALQLENILRLPPHKTSGRLERKKRKRRATL
ncbi:hypothetical protein RUM44_001615 [Polyplax serrata]|uniref:DH domain-containing protein n=1 Tax=Polyplax serrata TaxID=468196 RepID=A0ABR1AKI0_POLSC